MMSILQGQIEGGAFVTVLIILVVICYFIYKEYPEFKKRITSSAKVDDDIAKRMEAAEKRVTTLEEHVKTYEERFARDYTSIHNLEDSVELNRRINTQTLEEMEILMRAMLDALKSLEELGADGKTKKAQVEISDYLARAAHRRP